MDRRATQAGILPLAAMNGTAQSGYGALYHNRAAPPRNCWAVALAAGLVA